LFCDESRVEALVLHEQPNAGRTVIEKFEQYTDVGFAVGLLTLGDVGAAKNDGANLPPPPRSTECNEGVGYFLGILKRSRV